MYTIKKTNRFKKSIKKYLYHTWLLERMSDILTFLSDWKKLPTKYLDHWLKWVYMNERVTYFSWYSSYLLYDNKRMSYCFTRYMIS